MKLVELKCYNNWQVVDLTVVRKGLRPLILCECVKCNIQKYVGLHHLLSGRSKGCRICSHTVLGTCKQNSDPIKRSTYRSYQNMFSRCYRPSSPEFKRYSKSGIKVCNKWKKGFSFFLADLGWKPSTKHSIERINNSLGYTPKNCKWALPYEQARNKSGLHWITFKGETRILADWASLLDIEYMTIFSRLKRGWSIERALSVTSR